MLRDTPLQDRKAEVDLHANYLHVPSTKILGVWWLSDQAVFTFRENAPSSEVKYTKRDPIGFLAPFIIRDKMLLQLMWMTRLDWNDELTKT